VGAKALAWSGPKGGKIHVGFDDAHFGLQQMSAELDFVRKAYPNLPDEVPPGSSFVIAKEGTGHLAARFRVGSTVYRGGGQRDLRRLWGTVGLIDGLLHPERHAIVS
jgi:hypothetical protein